MVTFTKHVFTTHIPLVSSSYSIAPPGLTPQIPRCGIIYMDCNSVILLHQWQCPKKRQSNCEVRWRQSFIKKLTLIRFPLLEQSTVTDNIKLHTCIYFKFVGFSIKTYLLQAQSQCNPIADFSFHTSSAVYIWYFYIITYPLCSMTKLATSALMMVAVPLPSCSS